MGKSVDEGDGAGGVWKCGPPVLEGEVGGYNERFLCLISVVYELEEQIGGAVLIAEISELVDLFGAPHKPIYGESFVMRSFALGSRWRRRPVADDSTLPLGLTLQLGEPVENRRVRTP